VKRSGHEAGCDQGICLKSAISWYLEGFAKRSNIQISFESDPDFGRLSRDVELALFRVLQESLTNVHRHSESPTASVRLAMENGQAVLQIADTGKGLPSELQQQLNGEAKNSWGVGCEECTSA
jgi:signal transduction histidine kinase